MKIVHLTSAHPRYDTRIFLKMCRSLAAAGHDVTLVVADGKGNEQKEGVQVIDVGASSGRLARMTDGPRRVLARAQAIDADIFHLHDPELLPIGVKLGRSGARVVFDSHEDYPASIISKPYIPELARPAVAKTFGAYERHVCKRLDGVIAATPAIRDKFLRMGVRCLDVNNYPMRNELAASSAGNVKKAEVCYIGGIGAIRGIRQVVAAMGLTVSGARLNLGGPFERGATKAEVEAMPGWASVDELGVLSRLQVRDVMARSVAGIVTFLPEPNHVTAQPNKMFEYMSAGLPVIASDFPLWREIIEGNECGLCVDPLDPSAIAAAIDRLVKDPQEARRLGDNGRRAVLEGYNWDVEERKLLEYYTATVLPVAAAR